MSIKQNQPEMNKPKHRLPSWLKRPLPDAGDMAFTKQVVNLSGIATVCQEAHCPNLVECWSHKTATFMILGHHCTRRCRFCAVTTAKPDPPDPDEPSNLAEAVNKLGIKHVVITAVARDDLPDEGAGHFAACIQAVRETAPSTTIEVLPADFHARKECIATVCDAKPDLFNHNLETVQRLSPKIRPQADYHRSLEVLRQVKDYPTNMVTKSGLMVGLGEEIDEIHQAMTDLCEVGCEILTIGQYLQPSPKHAPVAKFYTPDEFRLLGEKACEMGFVSVASAPYVRSSYNAAEVFQRIHKQQAYR